MSETQPVPRRALVTGASGYIGTNLVKRLVAEGWNVHVVIRHGSKLATLAECIEVVTVHEHDGTTISMIDLVAAAQPDTVFHLASLFLAQHQPEDVQALINSNLLFSCQLAEAMAANGITTLINTGTSWQHFEDADYNPVNLYAATKQAFEVLLDYYVQAHGFTVTTLALFDTYGPNDPRPKLVHLLWKTAMTASPLFMSPGEQQVDLVHIDDVLDAYLLAAHLLLKQQEGHVRYGISSGKPMRLKDLVVQFEQATGSSLPITWGGRPYRPRESMIPWTSFNALPGWSAKIPFKVGILQTRPRG